VELAHECRDGGLDALDRLDGDDAVAGPHEPPRRLQCANRAVNVAGTNADSRNQIPHRQAPQPAVARHRSKRLLAVGPPQRLDAAGGGVAPNARRGRRGIEDRGRADRERRRVGPEDDPVAA
jgi:hypothetical protein